MRSESTTESKLHMKSSRLQSHSKDPSEELIGPRGPARERSCSINGADVCIGKHVFVLCHGYQGNSWDMRLFKNHLQVMCPKALFLMSTTNETKTEGDIAEMGQALAIEIVDFLEANCPDELCRLSFICHSLGGIIMRSALTCPEMKPYLSRLHTFLSLAVCHVGYLYSSNVMLNTGLWVMKKWNKSTCLSQLTLTDAEDPRQSFMYKLSRQKGLEYFNHVLLVSSPEDRYTPYHSARIEKHVQAVEDERFGPIYNEMTQHILAPLEKVNFTRFDISFVNQKRNIDSFIGRAAHIFFLDQPLYVKMLIHVYRKYFLS